MTPDVELALPCTSIVYALFRGMIVFEKVHTSVPSSVNSFERDSLLPILARVFPQIHLTRTRTRLVHVPSVSRCTSRHVEPVRTPQPRIRDSLTAAPESRYNRVALVSLVKSYLGSARPHSPSSTHHSFTTPSPNSIPPKPTNELLAF
jgi:hypothetical protein